MDRKIGLLISLQRPQVHLFRLFHLALVSVEVAEIIYRAQRRCMLPSHAFSFPCSARRYIFSAFSILP